MDKPRESPFNGIFTESLFDQVRDRLGCLMIVMTPDNHQVCFYPYEQPDCSDEIFMVMTFDLNQFLVENGFMTHSSGKFVISEKL